MSKLKRLFFMIMYYGFTRHLPEHSYPRGMIFCKLRGMTARPLLRHCGKDVAINRGAHFGKGTKLSLGDESSLGINARIVGDVVISRWVGMAHNVFITASNRDFSRTDIPLVHQPLRPDAQVVIEEDVFIGSDVTILPGVRVATGNVIGASAVVPRNTPPWAVISGNPAKVVKWRKIPPADFDFTGMIGLTDSARRAWEEAHASSNGVEGKPEEADCR